MEVCYYRVKFSNYFAVNEYECPVEYYFKKYSLEQYLPIPRAKRYLNDEYVVVIPSKLSNEFINIIAKEEDCNVVLLKKDYYEHDNFEKTYVFEVYEKINGVNTVNLSIFKRQ